MFNAQPTGAVISRRFFFAVTPQNTTPPSIPPREIERVRQLGEPGMISKVGERG